MRLAFEAHPCVTPRLIARTSLARASITTVGNPPGLAAGRLRRWSMIACHSLISWTVPLWVSVATLL
jgi:hypothetical protein